MAEVTYKIGFNYTDFYNLDLDLEELGNTLDETLGEDEFYSYSWDNISLKDYWVDIGAKFVDVGLNNNANPDITTWNGTNLVLSPHAYDKLKNHLSSLGEFLPLTINNQTYFVFNCLNTVQADKSISEADIVDNLWMGVKSIGFDERSVKDNLIFKSKFDRCSALYCGDKFKSLVEELGLKGLIFNKDLLTSL
ncbi:hypothetical protein [Microbulbifer sp. JMSA003]|uniref:hypothetical protein n=1 Tax=Microbulbifer sp. JMSA003 TaxID=3243369 RepID=UPI004039D672